MTHDELLAKIEKQTIHIANKIKPVAGSCEKEIGGFALALRAVVELHRPTPDPMVPENMICWGCWTEFGLEWPEYPCDTIQAIEKELE